MAKAKTAMKKKASVPKALVKAVKAAVADGLQVVPVALLGHKADIGVMALGPDLWQLRALQSDLVSAGLEVGTGLRHDSVDGAAAAFGRGLLGHTASMPRRADRPFWWGSPQGLAFITHQ